MSRKKQNRRWTAGAAFAFGCVPVAAFALGGGGDAVFTAAVPAPPAGCAAPGMKPIGMPLEPQAETVKSAPYSGVGTTEVVTTLADGNRITRTNTMRYFRDGAGRMRTEYQLGAIGPFVPEESQSIVTITDPVAGKRYVLIPARKHADVFDLSAEKGAQARTAKAIVIGGAQAPGLTQTPSGMKGVRVFTPRSGSGIGGAGTMMAPGFAPGPNAVERAGTPATAAATAPAPPRGDVFFVNPGPMTATCSVARTAPQAVSIGERQVEGLKVTGSRLELTIEAGEVGNEQPITVRTDQWFSPELGVVVSSESNDPMIGATTYRLEQIKRTEPDEALFSVPADYSKTAIN